MGSTNVVTNSAGTMIELNEYKPFGGFSRHDQFGTSNAAWYYFTGKPLDDETGLMFYGARYYSPVLGRFITPDSIVQGPMNPQTLNRYSYCNNNPVSLIDGDGHFWFIPLLIAAVKGAIVGALTGGAIAAATGGNIAQGFLTGAIGGAIFGVTGNLIKGWGMLGKVLAHTAAGGLSGGLGSVATGGDFGKGALIGGLAAGAATYIGGKVNLPGGNSSNIHIKFASDFVKQTLIGAAVGGAVSSATGGSFASGARYGAISGAISFTANESLHDGRYLKDFIDKIWTTFGEGMNNIVEAILTGDYNHATGSASSAILTGAQALLDVGLTWKDPQMSFFEKGVMSALQVAASGSTLLIGSIGAADGAAFARVFTRGVYIRETAVAGATLYGGATALLWKNAVLNPLKDYFRKE